jgi:hypothetical protein
MRVRCFPSPLPLWLGDRHRARLHEQTVPRVWGGNSGASLATRGRKNSPLIPAMFPVHREPFSRRRRAHWASTEHQRASRSQVRGRPGRRHATHQAHHAPHRVMLGDTRWVPRAANANVRTSRVCPSPSGEGHFRHREHCGDEGKSPRDRVASQHRWQAPTEIAEGDPDSRPPRNDSKTTPEPHHSRAA